MDALDRFRDLLAEAGQPVDEIIVDGRIHRYDPPGAKRGRKPCWYVLYDLPSGHLVGSFGDWRVNDKGTEFRSWESGAAQPDAEQTKRYRAQAAAARKRSEQELAAARKNAAEDARILWPKLSPIGESKYLLKKGVGAYGIRFGRDPFIAVPIRSGQEWRGIQRIYDDGSKHFPYGTHKQGAYALVGNFAVGGFVYVCEGYGTAASIHEATGSICVVAFDAYNVAPVIESLIAERIPRTKIVACLDNDQWNDKGNTGARIAEEIRYRFNVRAVLPSFEGYDTKDKPTDFNDLARLAGIEEVQRQLGIGEIIEPPPPPKTLLLPKPYVRKDPRTLAPRPFVYADHYAKGYVSATVSPGGGGKSSFGIVEAISMALGRCLYTGEPIRYGPMRVWYLALEDPEDEMDRKIEAVCLHYNITGEIPNLHLHSGRERPVCMAVEMRSSGGMVSVVAQSDAGQIKQQCQKLGIDVLIVDPSVGSHAVSENDPVRQDKVMAVWRQISEDVHVGVELQHHSRKLNGQQITIDDVRGATSIINSARSIRLIAPMSTDDAEELRVEEDRRGYYFAVVNGKANFMPPAKERAWYEFHSVCLGNETKQCKADEIGVVERCDFRFERTKEAKMQRQREDTQVQADQVWRYLKSEFAIGHYHSKATLEALAVGDLGMGRNELRAALAALMAAGRVTEESWPKAEKGKKKYLHPSGDEIQPGPTPGAQQVVAPPAGPEPLDVDCPDIAISVASPGGITGICRQ